VENIAATQEKYKKWFRYFLFALVAGLLIFSVIRALKPSDFSVYLEAGNYLKNGQNPYGEWLFVSEGNYCKYFYSPLWALILIPFTYFPPFIPSFIWLLGSIFFLYRIAVLLRLYAHIQRLNPQLERWVFMGVLVCSARFVLDNFAMVQLTIFLVWSSLEALRLMQSKNWVYGAALLPFAINVKLLPLVLIPYLLYRGHFKATTVILLFSVFYLLVPALFLGWEMNTLLLQGWFDVINPSNAEHTLETELGPHSLTALIPTLFSKTDGILDLNRNLFSFSLQRAITVLQIVRLALILLTLYFIGKRIFRPAETALHELYALAYIFLLIPLIFPHQQKYAFFCLVPTFYYIFCFLAYTVETHTGIKRRKTAVCVLLAISFVCMTLTTDGFVGRDLNEVFQHYKLITYGALLLIPALMLAHPKFIQR